MTGFNLYNEVQSWQDMRKHVKAKKVIQRKYTETTGGGPMNPNSITSTPVRSAGKRPLKQLTKPRRLAKSNEISEQLTDIEQRKCDVVATYYAKKTDYLSWREEYEKQKLKMMQGRIALKKLLSMG
nr:unnamed protein product [Callosobruchus analis]